MLDNIEDLQARRRFRDLQAAPPRRKSGPIRQAAGSHNRAMEPIGVLAMSADLQIQRSVEVPGFVMNLPQALRMGDDRQRRAASFPLN